MKKKLITLFILALAVIILGASCITAPVCVTSSTTPIYGKTAVQNLGKTGGSSSAWSLLGLWMIGRPDIGEAINEALRKKQGTALVNVKCYETYRWFLIFSITTVSVEGDAVLLSEGK